PDNLRKDLERHAVRTCHRPPRAAAVVPEHRRTWREALRHRWSKAHIESWSYPQTRPSKHSFDYSNRIEPDKTNAQAMSRDACSMPMPATLDWLPCGTRKV